MSSNIDERIVEMQFENGQFEKGVQESLKSLDELKKALELDKSAKSLEALEKAAGNVNFDKLADNVDHISKRFTLLGEIGMQAMERIATKAVDAGEKMLKAITIEMPGQGWAKYNSDVQATQTIINATGKDISEVNAQLEKLMWFTDETSYNYSDMVNNIGKFTANGRDLEESATAMMGISLWAARSGQHVNEAARAMYNLSQALGMGYVGVMDWKSIELANMATKEFKETAIQTAKELGKIRENADITVENFRSTLKDKWLDNDVLLATLSKYGNYTERVYQEYLASGKEATASDIIKLLEAEGDELGKAALIAGQEAITFAQAMEATKDAVSSKWMKLFKIIIGDYEQAKELWTVLANDLYDVFAWPIQRFNDIFEEGWAAIGGREIMVQGLVDIFHSLFGIVSAVRTLLVETFGPVFVSAMNAASIGISYIGEQLALFAESLGIEREILENQEYHDAAEGLDEYAESLENLDRNLKRGSRGEDVALLQERLIALGYLDEGMADGIYGPKTQDAVMRFQKDMGIAIDGIYGPISHQSLGEAMGLTGVIEKIEKLNENTGTPINAFGGQSLLTATEEILGLNKLYPTLKKNSRVGSQSLLTAADSMIELGTSAGEAISPLEKYGKGFLESAKNILDALKNAAKFVGTIGFEIVKTLLSPLGLVFHLVYNIFVCVSNLVKKINWQDITTKGLAKVQGFLQPISDKFYELTTKVREFFEEGIQVHDFATLWEKLQTELLKTEFGQKLFAFFEDIKKTEFWAKATGFFTKLRDNIKSLPKQIKKTTNGFKQWWKTGLFPRNMRFLQKPLDNIRKPLVAFWSEIKESWDVDGFTGVFTLLQTKLDGFVNNIANSIRRSRLGQMFSTLFSWFKDSAVYKGITSAWDNIRQFFTDIANSDPVAAAKSVPEKIANFVTELNTKIQSLIDSSELLTDLKNKILSIGRWFSQLGDVLFLTFQSMFGTGGRTGSTSLFTATDQVQTEATNTDPFSPIKTWLSSQWEALAGWVEIKIGPIRDRISLALSNFLKSLGFSGEGIKVEDIYSEWKATFDKLVGWFTGLIFAFKASINSAFAADYTEVGSLIPNGPTSILTAIDESAPKESDAWAPLKAWLSQQWESFVSWVETTAVSIGNRISTAFQGLLESLGIADEVNAVITTLTGIWDSIKAFFKEVSESDDVQKAETPWDKIVAFINGAFVSLMNKLGLAQQAEAVTKILSNIWKSITDFFKGVAKSDAVVNSENPFETVINFIKEFFRQLTTQIFGEEISQELAVVFSGVLSAISGFLSAIADGTLLEQAKAKWGEVTSFLSQVFGDLNEILGGESSTETLATSSGDNVFAVGAGTGLGMGDMFPILGLFSNALAEETFESKIEQTAQESVNAVQNANASLLSAADTENKDAKDTSDKLKEKSQSLGETISGAVGGFFSDTFNFVKDNRETFTSMAGIFTLIQGGRFLGNANGLLKSFRRDVQPMGVTILEIAAAFDMIAGAIYVLGTQIDEDQLNRALNSIETVFKWLIGFIFALMTTSLAEIVAEGAKTIVIAKKAKDLFTGKGDSKASNSGSGSSILETIAGVIKSIGIGLLTMAAAIAIFGSMKESTFNSGLDRVKAIMSAVVEGLKELFGNPLADVGMFGLIVGTLAAQAVSGESLDMSFLSSFMNSITLLLGVLSGLTLIFAAIETLDVFNLGLFDKGLEDLKKLLKVAGLMFAQEGAFGLLFGLLGSFMDSKIPGSSSALEVLPKLINAMSLAIVALGVMAIVLGGINKVSGGAVDQGVSMIERMLGSMALVIGSLEVLVALGAGFQPMAIVKIAIGIGAALVILAAAFAVGEVFIGMAVSDICTRIEELGGAVTSFKNSVSGVSGGKEDIDYALEFLTQISEIIAGSGSKGLFGGTDKGKELASNIFQLAGSIRVFVNGLGEGFADKWKDLKLMLTEFPGVVESIVGASGNIGAAKTVLEGFSAALALYYGNLEGVVIDETKTVGPDKISEIFTTLKEGMPENSEIAELAEYVQGGGSSMMSFAEGMVNLATGIKEYSGALKGVNFVDQWRAQKLTSFLSELNTNLKNANIQELFGSTLTMSQPLRDRVIAKAEGGLSDFGQDITDLATGIGDFGRIINEIVGTDSNVLSNMDFATEIIKKVAGMGDTIQKTGGFATFTAFIEGTPNWSKFAMDMTHMATGVNNFVKALDVTVSEDDLRSAKLFGELALGYATLGLTIKDVETSFTAFEDLGLTTEDMQAYFNFFAGLGELAKYSMIDYDDDTANPVVTFLQDLKNASAEVSAGFSETDLYKAMDVLGVLGENVNNLERLKASDTIGELAKKINTMMTGLASTVKNNEWDGILDFMTSLTGLATAVAEQEGSMTGTGEAMTSNMASGMKSGTSLVTKAATSVVGKAKDRVTNSVVKNDFKNAGYALMFKLSEGIINGESLVVKAMDEVVQALIDKYTEETDTNSPSRVMIEKGAGLMEGLAIGIDDDSGLATSSVKNAATSVIESAESALTPLASILNGDFNADPVIRPVVNMDNVHASAMAMNSLLGGNRKVNVGLSTRNARNVSGAMRRRASENQNGSRSDVITNNNSNDVNINGNFYVRDDQDIRSLANEIAALTRQDQRSLGTINRTRR